MPPAGWSWSTMASADGARLRYGHAIPDRPARAAIVLLTGYREFGEKYFETARELIRNGYAVWQIDWRGQGASDRYFENREKVGAVDFADDARDLKRFLDAIVRPATDAPLVLIAHSMGGLIALRYLFVDPAGADALVLSAPMLALRTGWLPEAVTRTLVRWIVKVGFGHHYLPGFGDWDHHAANDGRPGVATLDPRRSALQRLWPEACPQLRMGGATFAWLNAALASTAFARKASFLRAITLPVLIGSAEDDAFVVPDAHAVAADFLPNARLVTFAGSRHELFMERNEIRSRWMATVMAFLNRTLPPAPAASQQQPERESHCTGARKGTPSGESLLFAMSERVDTHVLVHRTEDAMTDHRTTPATDAVAIGPLTFKPLSPVVGAEVCDLELSVDLDDGAIDAIRAGLDRFGVLLFRRQTLEPGDQVELTKRFGPLQEVAQKQYQMADHPFVYVIGNVEENGRPIGDPSVGRLWHSDQSFIRHPAFGSLLHGVTCPEEGADTCFANMYRAYETLTVDVRNRIATLHAVHSFADYYQALRQRDSTQPPLTETRRSQFPDTVHPLVRRNPRTGRKALYINPGYATGIVEVPGAEGEALLRQLCAHAQRDDLVYAHRWRNGDVLFWDNLAVNHKGTEFDTGRYVRRMHRTTVSSNAEAYAATLLPAQGGPAATLPAA